VEQFPMTVTGKIQKYIMRQEMSQELAVAEEKTA
jgi:fatty-acyl-CoA synthase